MKRILRIVCIIAWSLLAASAVVADDAGLKLPGIFTDHMVLQREMPVPVWGWAEPGDEVTVEFAGQKKTAKAAADGKWMVRLDPLPASAEPRELVVELRARSGSDGTSDGIVRDAVHRLPPGASWPTESPERERRDPAPESPERKRRDPDDGRLSGSIKSTLTDVLVGDVWLCTGQSNMGMGVRGALNGEQEIASAQFSAIRLFIVNPNPVFEPAADLHGALRSKGWEVCSPQNVGDFSGVGYFFGRELHRELKIPIGLLRTSVGATEAETWTSIEALRTLPQVVERAEALLARGKSQEEDNKKFVVDREAWEQQHGVKPPPVSEAARTWADPDIDTADWTVVTRSASWGQLRSTSGGVFWARKELTLPQESAGKAFNLGLGAFDEQYDTAYFNGVELDRLHPDKAPDFYMGKRYYKVPGSLVKAGRNVIAVRVVSATDRAGMWQLVHPLELPARYSGFTEAPWVIRKELSFPPLTAEALASRPKPNHMPLRDASSALYNGMVAPLMPFAVKGAIWYQGESNTPRPLEYRDLLSTMIRDWRTRWGQGDFPFLIMQLVNNGAPATNPNASPRWPVIREAQAQVADAAPNCGIAIGIDIGEANNIHPKNKQDAGRRLALVALEKVYGKEIESSGPRFAAMTVDGPTVRLTFSHAAGLAARDGPPRNFAIAGADRKFVWADVKLEGDTILVTSPQVPAPVAVRYAWADNPEGCNLFNAARLPMAPFRTDDWPVAATAAVGTQR